MKAQVGPLHLVCASVSPSRTPVVCWLSYPQAGTTAERSVRQAAASNRNTLERERALELLRGGTGSVERWNRWRAKNPGPFDLAHARLARTELSGANLANVDLHASDLSGAKLVGANFEGADLHRSNLKAADLSLAILRGADLRAANLSRASLFALWSRSQQIKRSEDVISQCGSRRRNHLAAGVRS
jgi:hypothetical protein